MFGQIWLPIIARRGAERQEVSMPSPTETRIHEITELLRPYIDPIIERINVDEFTTVEFIEALQMDDDSRRAYENAIERWVEPGEFRAKTVVHGQVIPILLRQSELVEWAGFAHGQPDQYAVPAWWRKTRPEEPGIDG
jgi:hypothetical protein